ncbi:MAG TPA: cyclic nucleotide-binding domain-containing protein [Nitrospiria bacterium]
MGKTDLTSELQESIRRKDWPGAVRALEGLVKLEPKNASHRLRLGEFHVKAGNQTRAVEAYQKAAELFGASGFIVKALAAYKIILRIDPSNAKARAGISGLHSEAKEQALELSMSIPNVPPVSPGGGGGSETSGAPVMDAWEISKKHLMQDIEQSGTAASRKEEAPGAPPADKTNSPAPVSASGRKEDDEEELDEGLIGSAPMDLDSYGETGGEKEDAKPTSAPESPSGLPDPEPASAPAAKGGTSNAVALFSGLTKEEFSEVADRMNPYLFDSGSKIVSEGDAGNSVFVISSGTVEVLTTIGDREVVLAELKDNDFFGEVSFLTGRPRTADIVAKTATEILELPGDDLKAVIEKFPRVKAVLEEFHRSRALDTLEKILPQGKEDGGNAD